MNPTHPGRMEDDPVDDFSPNKHNALSGSDVFGELEGSDPEHDAKIKQKVLEKLYNHPEYDFSKIEVTVKDGFVALVGLIDSPESKAVAIALVESVDGVVDVARLLELDRESAVSKSLSGNKGFRLP